jgi:hypothetical protein
MDDAALQCVRAYRWSVESAQTTEWKEPNILQIYRYADGLAHNLAFGWGARLVLLPGNCRSRMSAPDGVRPERASPLQQWERV